MAKKTTAFKERSKGSRKTPRMTSQTQHWFDLLAPILIPLHKSQTKRVFYRIMNKTSTLKSNLKQRSKDYGVKCNTTLDSIRNMFINSYGKKCRYCNEVLKLNNMACDHVHPISNGGESTLDNLQFICKRCNRRKGPLSHIEYYKVLKFIIKQKKHVQDYLFRKLSNKDVY